MKGSAYYRLCSFVNETSSPENSHSNGAAEAGVTRNQYETKQRRRFHVHISTAGSRTRVMERMIDKVTQIDISHWRRNTWNDDHVFGKYGAGMSSDRTCSLYCSLDSQLVR